MNDTIKVLICGTVDPVGKKEIKLLPEAQAIQLVKSGHTVNLLDTDYYILKAEYTGKYPITKSLKRTFEIAKRAFLFNQENCSKMKGNQNENI